jgi:hypothetical protein
MCLLHLVHLKTHLLELELPDPVDAAPDGAAGHAPHRPLSSGSSPPHLRHTIQYFRIVKHEMSSVATERRSIHAMTSLPLLQTINMQQ